MLRLDGQLFGVSVITELLQREESTFYPSFLIAKNFVMERQAKVKPDHVRAENL